jgi:hypothetical protein
METYIDSNKNSLLMSNIDGNQKITVSQSFLLILYLLSTAACGIQLWQETRKDPSSFAQDEENAVTNMREGNERSAGDATRASVSLLRVSHYFELCIVLILLILPKFFCHLCVALTLRSVLLPIEIMETSSFWKIIAVTLPDITFALAWTLIVSFFAQLVATVSGFTVFRLRWNAVVLMASFTYIILVLVCLWRSDLDILLYGLFCFWYGSLFCTILYVGPRLVSILQPNLTLRSGLAIRLVLCTIICLLSFFARLIFLIFRMIRWSYVSTFWISYGAIELFPSIVILAMMYSTRPQKGSLSQNALAESTQNTSRPENILKRVENVPLIKTNVTYGTSVNDIPT